MCYPKPGPRCSSHARADYLAAQKHTQKVLAEIPEEGERGAWEQAGYEQARANEEAKRLEYLKTPEGIKRLRAQGDNTLAKLYEVERATQIRAYKKQKRDKLHKTLASNLEANMEFDTPYSIGADGSVTYNQAAPSPPEYYDNTLDGDGWEPVNGFSGQQGYKGPVMHNSEVLEGRAIESHLLDNPGTYAVVAAQWENKDEEWADVEPYVTEGWVLLRKKD